MWAHNVLYVKARNELCPYPLPFCGCFWFSKHKLHSLALSRCLCLYPAPSSCLLFVLTLGGSWAKLDISRHQAIKSEMFYQHGMLKSAQREKKWRERKLDKDRGSNCIAYPLCECPWTDCLPISQNWLVQWDYGFSCSPPNCKLQKFFVIWLSREIINRLLTQLESVFRDLLTR